LEKVNQRLDALAIVILLILCTSWGLQHVTIKVANRGISPLMQCGIRSLGAGVLVWIWMIVRRQPLWEKDGTLWWGFAAGALFAIEFLLVYWGLEYTNASRAIIFVYMSPFVVALGAQLFIPGERLRLIQVIGLCCAFAGVVTAFGESMGMPTYQILIGDLMAAVAAVFWGATTVLIKASPLAKIDPSKTLLYQLAVSAVMLPMASLLVNEPGIVFITPLIVGCLVYQTVWVATITYIAWFWLIKHYPASRLASFTFLTPILGVFAGGLLLHEEITRALLLAMVLVGVGIYMVNRPPAG
jgi:drug/metabolite transporter (DMT)-like permease